MLNKSPRDLEKLAGLGAIGASAGIMAAWLGLLFILRPVPTGGIDGTSFFAVAASTFAVMFWLAVAHLWFGLQLKRGADSIRG